MLKTDRRKFLTAGAAAAALAVVPRSVLGGENGDAPSDKLNIAGIGVGGMGGHNVNNVDSEHIAALCDVDHAFAARMFKKYPQAKKYKDYREMLAVQKDLDAVIIGTPDHTHAVISVAAIRAGKHVYCQKPLTHDVWESRVVAEEARKAGVITQMGIQGHSRHDIRMICEWIWDGAIGEVREVDAWCSLTYYPYGHASWSSKWASRPKDTPKVPDGLDWDTWIGPAPMRPYHRAYHPTTWRSWLDFGVGMMGDRGAHTFDPVFWPLKLGHPTSVDATSTFLNKDTYPLASIVRYEFPKRGDLPPVTLTWYDGLRPPRPECIEDGRRLGESQGGVIFKGSEGMLTCGVYGGSPRLIPETKMKAYKRPKASIPRVKTSHEMDWVLGCKSGKQPGACFDYSGPLTEAVLLGNVAKLMDTRIVWDGPNLKVTNLPAANKLIRREYRDGWSL